MNAGAVLPADGSKQGGSGHGLDGGGLDGSAGGPGDRPARRFCGPEEAPAAASEEQQSRSAAAETAVRITPAYLKRYKTQPSVAPTPAASSPPESTTIATESSRLRT